MTQVVTVFPRKVATRDPVFITMKDGVRLAATIWLPEDADERPVPAILELIPYRRRDGTVFRDMKMHPYVAGHGFACCRVKCHTRAAMVARHTRARTTPGHLGRRCFRLRRGRGVYSGSPSGAQSGAHSPVCC